MNEKIALLGVVEILSALSCGIAILFSTYKILKIYGKKKLNIDHNNTAYNVFMASVLFSVGYVVSGVVQPILNSYRILSGTDVSKLELIIGFITYGGLYILISYISALIISFLGIIIYTNMTSVNEFNELKDNNIGVAVMLSAIIITLSIMCSDGIILLIESFIPYPNRLPNIG